MSAFYDDITVIFEINVTPTAADSRGIFAYCCYSTAADSYISGVAEYPRIATTAADTGTEYALCFNNSTGDSDAAFASASYSAAVSSADAGTDFAFGFNDTAAYSDSAAIAGLTAAVCAAYTGTVSAFCFDITTVYGDDATFAAIATFASTYSRISFGINSSAVYGENPTIAVIAITASADSRSRFALCFYNTAINGDDAAIDAWADTANTGSINAFSFNDAAVYCHCSAIAFNITRRIRYESGSDSRVQTFRYRSS